MTPASKPEPSILHELLRCDAEAGKLFWRFRPRDMFVDQRSFRTWNARYAGKEAFTNLNDQGYKKGAILGKNYPAHRVIWAMSKGAWPAAQIDHINGERADNRICNLREANASENSMNMRPHKGSSSDYKGVSWHAQRQKWRAQIRRDGQHFSLGLHATQEAAHAAYCEASKLLHGKFGRTA